MNSLYRIVEEIDSDRIAQGRDHCDPTPTQLAALLRALADSAEFAARLARAGVSEERPTEGAFSMDEWWPAAYMDDGEEMRGLAILLEVLIRADPHTARVVLRMHYGDLG